MKISHLLGSCKSLTGIVCLCILVSGSLVSYTPPSDYPDDLIIWFTRPAEQWDNALPVGNGRLGAMVFGGVETERLQLNERTGWTGRDEDYNNPESLEGLKHVRKLLFEGK